MAGYGRYAMSAPFARLLAEFVIEEGMNTDDPPVLVHEPCVGQVRTIEGEPLMDAILQSCIDHDCTG